MRMRIFKQYLQRTVKWDAECILRIIITALEKYRKNRNLSLYQLYQPKPQARVSFLFVNTALFDIILNLYDLLKGVVSSV